MDGPHSLEERMDDLGAVLDAAGSRRSVLLGFSEGGTMSALFAATYPERSAGLMLWGAWVRQLRGEGFPFGWTREEGMNRSVRPIQREGTVSARWFAPSLAGAPEFEEWFARYARQSASPGMAIALLKANAAMDVRDVLGSITVPALVLHRTNDSLAEVGQGRYLAEHIPSARLIEFRGRDHWPWAGDSEPVLTEIEAFVRECGSRPTTATDRDVVEAEQRILATVLAVVLPDPRAPMIVPIVTDHRGIVLERSAGRMVARFDAPGRAVGCAVELLRRAGGPSRAGLHGSEVAVHETGIQGMALEVAAEPGSSRPGGPRRRVVLLRRSA